MLRSLLLFGIYVLAYGLSYGRSSATNLEKKAKIEQMIRSFEGRFSVPQMSVDELKVRLKAGTKLLLVDVRDSSEQAVSMLPGAMTVEQFEANIRKYREHVVVAYCTIGYRSSKFVKKHLKTGLNIKNLRGSVLLWSHAKGGFVDSNGQKTKKVHVYGRSWSLLADGYEAILN